jgi:hypothetical protein
MIPKKIHYCWFGYGQKPPLALRCINSWHKYCPDYEIVEWNENNFDLASAPLYVRQAYENKKWAFVTDYVRLRVVFNYGGIYLDTDVELIKSVDFLLNYNAFFGFEDSNYVATGLGFGAVKGNQIISRLMDDYSYIPFILPDGSFNIITCPIQNTATLKLYGLVTDNTFQIINDNVAIFPSQYFCPLSYYTGKMKKTSDTVSIHWYSASWLSEEKRKKHNKRVRKNRLLRPIKDAVKLVLGKRLSSALKKKVYGEEKND